jgi:hypothetical protein
MNHFFHPKARKPVLLLAFAVLLSLAGTAASAGHLPRDLPTVDTPPPALILNRQRGALADAAGQNSAGTAQSSLEFLGQIGGTTYAAAAQGNYAYVGIGPRLAIVDVADPVHPSLLGQTKVFQKVVQGVAVEGDYAYAVDGNPGLYIVDVSNPMAPAVVGFYDLPGSSLGVAVAGSFAYVASHWEGLRIVDVSNPAAPTEVGYYDTPGYAVAVTVAGSYAYVADDEGGLRVVDISDPTAPLEVGSLDTECAAVGVAADVRT